MVTNDPEYMRKYMNRYRKLKRNRIVQQLGGKCVKCFTAKKLEIHHEVSVQRGKQNTYDNFVILMQSIRNHDRLIVECRECHPRGICRTIDSPYAPAPVKKRWW